MRRVVVALTSLARPLALALIVGLMSVIPTMTIVPPAEAAMHCGDGHRQGQTGRASSAIEWRVASIHKPCLRLATRHRRAATFVKPQTLRISYVDHGRVPICELPGTLDYVEYTAYYSDSQGRNFKVGPYRLDCQQDGFNTKVIVVRNQVGFLKSTIDHPAKLRVNIKAVRRDYRDNEDDSAFLLLRWFNSPIGKVLI